MIDICIPVYRNLRCFDVCLKGWKRHIGTSYCRLVLHVQDSSERDHVRLVATLNDFDFVIINTVPEPRTMATIMDALFNASTSDWVIMTEQDVFPTSKLSAFEHALDREGYILSGPLDTFYLTHPNARGQPHYGLSSRLSPEPGYFHSSLVYLKREEILALSRTPFTIPNCFKMHGYGVLGAEPYYGLRVNCGKDATKMSFLTQQHAGFGYSALIATHNWDVLATHLYFSSSTVDRRHRGNFLTESEHDWLVSEQERFLKAYTSHL